MIIAAQNLSRNYPNIPQRNPRPQIGTALLLVITAENQYSNFPRYGDHKGL